MCWLWKRKVIDELSVHKTLPHLLRNQLQMVAGVGRDPFGWTSRPGEPSGARAEEVIAPAYAAAHEIDGMGQLFTDQRILCTHLSIENVLFLRGIPDSRRYLYRLTRRDVVRAHYAVIPERDRGSTSESGADLLPQIDLESWLAPYVALVLLTQIVWH